MSVAQGTSADLPGYDARTFTLMPVGSTSQRSVQVSGFTDICLFTPLRRLYPLPVRQASALPTASSRFAVTRDTLAVRLTLLLAECVEDFHLQVRAPCRAHKQKGPSACAKRALRCCGSLCRVGTARCRAIPPLEPGVRVSPHPAQASAKPLLPGPALQRQTSGMKLTVAIRVQQDQISVVVGTAFTLREPMVDIPPRFLGDQLVA